MAAGEWAFPEAEALDGTGLPSQISGGDGPTFEDVAAMAGIFPARAKVRLTDEEKLAKEVERRRQQDIERRARLFDAKRRAIGLDMETLDAQVKERKAREEAEKANKKAEAQEMLKINAALKQAENVKLREKKDAEKEAKDFSLNNLHFESRREFDLNDPKFKKKDLPARVGDLDTRNGVSGLQKFQGEDLMKDERTRQQKLAMSSWIEQQKFEKAAVKAKEADEDAIRRAYVAQILTGVDARQDEDSNFRQAARMGQNAFNVQKISDNAMQRADDRSREQARNAQELQFHSADPFLTETGQVILESGRRRRDAYKGEIRSERIQVAQQQLQQAASDADRKAREKAEELAFQREAEMTRKQLVAMEREKQRNRRAAQEKMAQENIALRKAQANKTNYQNAVEFANVPTEEYFAQFGRSCR